MKRKRKTDFIIIGLQKTGTTSLNEMLDQHPDIFMIKPKECHYFATDLHREAEEQNLKDYYGKPLYKYTKLKDYEKLFNNVKQNQLIGECSPSYIDSREAHNNIYNYNKNIKIIFIERDEVSYIRSLIKMYDQKNQWDNLPKTLKDISWRLDFYLRYLLFYHKRFNNCLHINYEVFKEDNQKICNKIFKFLGLKEYKVKVKKLNTTNIKPLIKLRTQISKIKIFIQRAGTYITIPITILNFSMLLNIFLRDNGINISIFTIFIPLMIIFILIGYLDYKFKFFTEEIKFNQSQSILYNQLKKDIEEIKQKL